MDVQLIERDSGGRSPARRNGFSSRRVQLKDPLPEYEAALEVVRNVPFVPLPDEPTPEAYYGALLGPPSPARMKLVHRRLRYFRDLFEFAQFDPRGNVVVEAGSGFGLGLLLTASFGAKRASGVEIVPWMASYCKDWAAALPESLGSRIDPHAGDVSKQLPFDDESVDLVLSTEAMQHFRNYAPFLAEAHRVLRPGGILLISDGCNGLNPLSRRECRQIWASHEVDEPRRDEEDHPFHFVPKRQQIIEDAFPQLAGEEAHRLALETAGMVAEEIVEACRRFVETGVSPGSRYKKGDVSVHPVQGIVMEATFNPFALSREIATLGFRIHLRGHWAGASGKGWHRALNRALGALTPVTIFSARAFRIAATRI